MRDWSSIPKQKLLVENGEIGDCWRCCIAAVLGMPADVVPNFIQDEKGKLNSHMDPDTQLWLNDRGYAMICVRGDRNILYPRWNKKGVDLPLISCGPTERSKGMGKHHAVVTVWDKVVYDPHPSEAGLTAITEQWLLFRLFEHESAQQSLMRLSAWNVCQHEGCNQERKIVPGPPPHNPYLCPEHRNGPSSE